MKTIIINEEQLKNIISSVNEEKIKSDSFLEFSSKRKAGAKKITQSAKEKGGPALLTFNHFKVKLPYYTKAENGSFDPTTAKKEYQKLLDELVSATNNLDISQTDFQKLVGKIEVIGELIIKSKEQSINENEEPRYKLEWVVDGSVRETFFPGGAQKPLALWKRKELMNSTHKMGTFRLVKVN